MALDRTAALDALKEMYDLGEDTDMVFKSHALLGMTQRKKNMTGRYFHIPIQYGKPQGRSHNITTAGSNEYASKYEAFQVPPVSDYVVAKVSGLIVRMAANDSGNAGMFLDLMKSEMDGALSTLGDNVAKEQYGSFGGWRARVHPTTAISSTVLTLANPEDTWFFEVGMQICASDANGESGSLRDSGNAVTISAIDRDAGTLTGSTAWGTTISGITNNDYLFAEGDFGAAAAGLDSYVPSAAPSSALYGVARSADPERLGGIRYDGSSDQQETVYIRAMSRAARTKAKFKYVYTNPVNIANLAISKEGDKFIDNDNEYGIGFEGFMYQGIKIMPDNDCPVNVAYAIDPSAWVWCTNGNAPSLVDSDGVEFLRLGAATGDTFEIQGVIDHNFASPAPGKIMRITLPAG